MYSHSIDLARTIIGAIGNVLSFVLFISPSPTLWRILKNKSVEEFKFHPYIASVINCLLWVFYGLPLIHPHNTLIITINGVGLALELIYTTIYFSYADRKKRRSILIYLTCEVAIVAGVASIALTKFHSHKARSNFTGIFCTAFGIIMYASPLTVMWKVIKTKSVEYMPFSISLASFLNGVCWTIYALLEFDLFVLIGNGVGGLLGLSQLILYAVYCKSTPKKEEPSKVQLSTIV